MFFKKSFTVDEVFKAGGTPKITYVNREEISDVFDRVIKTRNKAMLILGYSKSGKTVFRKKYNESKKLHEIVFRCLSDSTIENLYNTICTELKVFPPTSFLSSDTSTVGTKQNLQGPEFSGNYSTTASTTSSFQKDLINLNFICEELKKQHNSIIVLEDYHLVNDGFNQSFSEIAKHLLDEEVLINIIGIPGAPNRTLKRNPDMFGRVEIVYFDKLNEHEIYKLLEKGSKALKIKFDQTASILLINFSYRNAYLIQAICNRACKSKGIYNTQRITKYITQDDIDAGCKLLLKELKEEYDPILEELINGLRGQTAGKAYNQYEEIFRAIGLTEISKLENGLTYNEIGRIAWNEISDEKKKLFIKNKTYKDEKTFKTSLNNQISLSMSKLEDIFTKKSSRPTVIYFDNKVFILDVVFKYYLEWKYKEKLV
jgi:hypothetical protein